MPKKPHRILIFVDLLMMAASLGILIYAGIFMPRSLVYALPAVTLVNILYALVLRISRRRLGFLLIAAGLGLCLAIPSNWLWSWYDQRHLEADFAQESASAVVLNRSILSGLEGAAEKEKIKQLANAYKLTITAGQTIGQLEIPHIGVNGIIVEGTEDASLRKGIGHMEGYPLPGMDGNFPVAGDRVLYGAPFLKLNEIVIGDEIKVKTTYGRFVYTVTGITKVSPDDVTVLESKGTDSITLITCDPPWSTSQRLIIKGDLVTSSLL